jgi:O-methyltransferase
MNYLRILQKWLDSMGLLKHGLLNYWKCLPKTFICDTCLFLKGSIFLQTFDPVRYGALGLAIKRIEENRIPGSFAEVGVYRGETRKMIHLLAPHRKLYLFDTFEGFPENLINGNQDKRFKDTNIALVVKTIGDINNIFIKEGYFFDTTKGLENDKFAFVMLYLDLYLPTKAGLIFFYERMSQGGYIFIHDYNSPESEWGVSRAVNEFMQDKPEGLIDIPDVGGSVIICKSKNC